MNLVLLKNVSIVGLHWGAYHRERRLNHFGTGFLTIVIERDVGRVPVVWRDLLSYASFRSQLAIS